MPSRRRCLSGYDSDPFGIDPGQTVLLLRLTTTDPFAIDPGQTVLLSSAEDADPFGIDPEPNNALHHRP